MFLLMKSAQSKTPNQDRVGVQLSLMTQISQHVIDFGRVVVGNIQHHLASVCEHKLLKLPKVVKCFIQ